MPVIKSRINSPAIMLDNKIGPPGLGIFGLLGLWLSFTTDPFEERNFIKTGINIIGIKKEITDVIIAAVINSS